MRIKGIPEAAVISYYLTVKQRLGFVKGWLAQVDEETDRIHGFVNTIGTVTHRMTHSRPNVAQTPNSHALFGKECRECWVADTGYKLLGVDASGLQLRLLAHYLGVRSYIDEILSGDIHTFNQTLAGIDTRDQAKTFIYAYIFGAGDKKLGSVVGGSAKDGARLRATFLSQLPALAALQKQIETAAKRGYLSGLDGRKVFIRSAHSGLAAALQSAEAIVMKTALVLLDTAIKENGWDARYVANIHDEFQLECIEEHCKEVGEAAVASIVEAGNLLALKCPLDGEYKVGNNWSETH